MKIKRSFYETNSCSKGIVYEFDGTKLEVTFEKISANNPEFTMEDFEKLKTMSDKLYLEELKRDNVERQHVRALFENEEYDKNLATLPLENILFPKESKYPPLEKVYKAMDELFTETQKRRFVLHKIKGISTPQIAAKEGVSQNVVWKSIMLAEKKLKEFFEIGV